MIPTMRKTNKQRTLQEVYEETNNTSCFVSVEDTEVQNLLLKHIRKGYTLLTSDKNKWLLILYPKKTNGKLSLQEMKEFVFARYGNINFQTDIEPILETKGFIAPKPQCYSERHIRSLKGEIFLLK